MALSPTSFLLGLGAAWALPIIARSLRQLTVEAAAAGIAIFDEGRRLVAEQMEMLEDIAAEVRARREEQVTQAEAGEFAEEPDEPDAEVTAAARGRRRAPARRATSDAVR